VKKTATKQNPGQTGDHKSAMAVAANDVAVKHRCSSQVLLRGPVNHVVACRFPCSTTSFWLSKGGVQNVSNQHCRHRAAAPECLEIVAHLLGLTTVISIEIAGGKPAQGEPSHSSAAANSYDHRKMGKQKPGIGIANHKLPNLLPYVKREPSLRPVYRMPQGNRNQIR